MSDLAAVVAFIQQYNLITAGTLVLLGWGARAYATKLVTNHMKHFTDEVIEAIEHQGDRIVIAVLEAKNSVAATR